MQGGLAQGVAAHVTGNLGAASGYQANAAATGTALGARASASGANAVALGQGATATKDNCDRTPRRHPDRWLTRQGRQSAPRVRRAGIAARSTGRRLHAAVPGEDHGEGLLWMTPQVTERTRCSSLLRAPTPPGAVKTGTAVLVGGTKAVTDAAITANSIIRLSSKTLGGTPWAVFVSAKTAGTRFTITSTSAADTSTIFYEIIAY